MCFKLHLNLECFEGRELANWGSCYSLHRRVEINNPMTRVKKRKEKKKSVIAKAKDFRLLVINMKLIWIVADTELKIVIQNVVIPNVDQHCVHSYSIVKWVSSSTCFLVWLEDVWAFGSYIWKSIWKRSFEIH